MKKSIITVLIILCMTVIVSCGKKNKDGELTLDDYINLANTYKTLYETSDAEAKSLREALLAYGVSGDDIEGLENIELLPDGTKPFLSINGKVNLKDKINIEPISRSPNQSKVYINDVVAIRPTKNWTMKFTDNSLIMEHNTGVYCEIESYQYTGEYDGISCYSSMYEPYIQSLGAKNHNTKVLFVGDSRVGYTTDVVVKVKPANSEDTKSYNYTFGLLISNGKITVFKFFYEKGSDDTAIKELVNNTICNISINGIGLNIE